MFGFYTRIMFYMIKTKVIFSSLIGGFDAQIFKLYVSMKNI